MIFCGVDDYFPWEKGWGLEKFAVQKGGSEKKKKKTKKMEVVRKSTGSYKIWVTLSRVCPEEI